MKTLLAIAVAPLAPLQRCGPVRRDDRLEARPADVVSCRGELGTGIIIRPQVR